MQNINRQVVEQLCNKLKTFSSTLSDEERSILKTVLEGQKELGDDELNKATGGTATAAFGSGTNITRKEVATFVVRAFFL
jgi:hypothetical protein